VLKKSIRADANPTITAQQSTFLTTHYYE
jgi:hypothetical protein